MMNSDVNSNLIESWIVLMILGLIYIVKEQGRI